MRHRPHRATRVPAVAACLVAGLVVLGGCSGGTDASEDSGDSGQADSDEAAAFCEEHAALPEPSAFKKWQQGWVALAEGDAVDTLPAQVREGVALQADLAENSFTPETARALEEDLVERESDALAALRQYVEQNC